MRYGIHSEKELLALAKKNNISTLALTDINNTSACLNFARHAPKYNIKPVLGIDFRNGIHQCFVGLAKNNHGFQQLNAYLSYHLHNKLPIPSTPPILENTCIIYPFGNIKHPETHSLASNEYIGIGIKDTQKFSFLKSHNHRDKMVILHPVTFQTKRDHNIHRLLRAMELNTLLSKLPSSEQASENDSMLSKNELIQAFSDFPFLIENTQRLLEHCHIDFDFSTSKESQNLQTYSKSPEEDYKKLVSLCDKGLTYRYDYITPAIKNRLQKELDLIKRMNYVSFFLINWDIIQYAKSKTYYHVGRGSGANSIVAYLLGITDVDPIDLDLYFERFMNLYRASPPDFDIDFSSQDRPDITRYIFERFGKNGQAALLGAYVTFKHSAAVRELGKVFGLPKQEIDRLSDNKYDPNKLDTFSRLVLRYAAYIQGKPNYLSIHAGGILISEKPMHYFSATHVPPKGFPTVQFDMVIAEDVGLYKFDILGQRGLGKIKDALSIIRKNHPQIVLPDIHNPQPFFADPAINKMISRAECIGCFYVESPAMRMLLKKLSVNNYLGLVAASSIIRPGVAKSGMMREYILRHKNPERRKEAHPILLDIMPDTYGVMVYQEDVIKVAHYFAGLDLSEADVLRRGMSGKFRSREEFQRVKQKFIDNCRQKGEPDTIIFDIWKQIESFAGYAFAKGHSASYAVESYQSLFLKCYYPLEYMVATINNGGGFYSIETYIYEARKQGGVVHVPCIQKSTWKTTIEGTHIYLGFQHLNGLEYKLVSRILQARQQCPFYSFEDFIERVSVGIEQLDLLIRINAFRFTDIDKRTLLWQAHYKTNSKPSDHIQQHLFKIRTKELSLPEFQITQSENAFDQIELLHFSLYDPFSLLEQQLTSGLCSKDLVHYRNKTITLYGYLITVKNTRTSQGKRMYFGTFLDRKGHWIDTVHFPPVAKKHPFRGKGVYKLTGKVVEEFGFLTLEISYMTRMAYIPDPRFSKFV